MFCHHYHCWVVFVFHGFIHLLNKDCLVLVSPYGELPGRIQLKVYGDHCKNNCKITAISRLLGMNPSGIINIIPMHTSTSFICGSLYFPTFTCKIGHCPRSQYLISQIQHHIWGPGLGTGIHYYMHTLTRCSICHHHWDNLARFKDVIRSTSLPMSSSPFMSHPFSRRFKTKITSWLPKLLYFRDRRNICLLSNTGPSIFNTSTGNLIPRKRHSSNLWNDDSGVPGRVIVSANWAQWGSE